MSRSAASAKMPAAAPIAAPRTSERTLPSTSVLASSISSRMRSCAFSVTSWIAVARGACELVASRRCEPPVPEPAAPPDGTGVAPEPSSPSGTRTEPVIAAPA
jgi:hypothetical protein